MNILVEIGHPAHVHFFARAIQRLETMGHHVSIITRNKEITNALLDGLKLPYRCLSTPKGKKGALLKELAHRWWGTLNIIRKEKIDRVVSISGITTSLPAKLCRVPNVVFTDTEDARITNLIAFPFADKIYTPKFFLGNLGKRHVRYRGLHEVAYLQHFDFEKAKAIRKQLGLPEKYVIVRIVANDALHDAGLPSLTTTELKSLIDRLSTLGRVYVTSQSGLPKSLAQYQLDTPIEHIHAILAGAQLFVGESPTMAVESSLLGTPAFLITPRAKDLGNMVCLERDHQLLINLPSWPALVEKLESISDLASLKAVWGSKACLFRNELPLMDDFIVQAILERPSCAP